MGDSPARDPGFSSGVDVGDERIPKTESPGARGESAFEARFDRLGELVTAPGAS